MKLPAILLTFAILVSCTTEFDAPTASMLPESMKGYELYSWQENNKGEWNHTLITGTNRNKTREEITAAENKEGAFTKLTVQGTRRLKQLLERVPQTEYISWIGNSIRTPGFELPPSSVVSEIEDHCKRLNLRMSVQR